MDVLDGLDLRGGRITSLADPASPQDAATKAYVDAQAGGGGGTGWVQIGPALATATGTNAAFTAIPATYSDLLLALEGLRHDSGSNQAFTLELSPDGSAWTLPFPLTAAPISAAATMYGSLYIPRYRGAAGFIASWISDIAADNATGPNAVSGSGRPWRVSAGLQALRLSVTGGAFAGGALKLFGRT